LACLRDYWAVAAFRRHHTLREFLMLTRTALISGLAASLLFMAGAAQALTLKPFTSADLASAQKAGQAVAVHFHATWCPTCKAQAKVFDALKADPALDKVTLLVADYDTEKELKKQLNVRAQSTVVVFKGKTEVARDGGSTEPAQLKALLSSAL
jgi:thioredoxin 1